MDVGNLIQLYVPWRMGVSFSRARENAHKYPVGTTVSYRCRYGFFSLVPSQWPASQHNGVMMVTNPNVQVQMGTGIAISQKRNCCFPQVISLLYEKFPKCFILASCPAINLQNGGVIYTAHTVNGRHSLGTSAQLICNVGFKRSGTYSRTCQYSRTWSRKETTCIASK